MNTASSCGTDIYASAPLKPTHARGHTSGIGFPSYVEYASSFVDPAVLDAKILSTGLGKFPDTLKKHEYKRRVLSSRGDEKSPLI